MRPTVLHAFTFLATHLSHQGDGELQDAERDALYEASLRIGLAARLDKGQARQMVYDAVDWYYDVAADRVATDGILRRCSDLLTDTFRANGRVLLALHEELQSIAEAHDGVLDAELRFLGALAEDWGIAGKDAGARVAARRPAN